MSIRGQDEFEDALNAELAWRKKELTALRFLISSKPEPVVFRSAITMSYAHWEGFVKGASESLLKFVEERRLSYEQLHPCFASSIFFHKARAAINSTIGEQIDFFGRLTDFQSGQRARFAALIRKFDTKSNLSSSVFDEICKRLGINPSGYEARYKWLDESMLKKRNPLCQSSVRQIRLSL